jgi:hypothetical protein
MPTEHDRDRGTRSFLKDPFVDRPPDVKRLMSKQSKRTQRYRSTASSRICGMTVGDIRFCFQQLRNAGDNLTSDMILYNGQTAGSFALAYLTETSNAMRKRRTRKRSIADGSVDGDSSCDDKAEVEIVLGNAVGEGDGVDGVDANDAADARRQRVTAKNAARRARHNDRLRAFNSMTTNDRVISGSTSSNVLRF